MALVSREGGRAGPGLEQGRRRLGELGGEVMAEPLRAQARDPGVPVGGQNDLGEPGVGEPTALPGPQRAWLAARLV